VVTLGSRDEFIDIVFSKNGLLSRFLEGFEERSGQTAMARDVLSTYSDNRIALIEAGTGIGKSLGYLVPAIFWALKAKAKTVISTHTIALQEQLILKDIPFLLNVMDLDLKVCLLKGMGNYLCLRKLKDLQQQPLLIALDEAQEIASIEKWEEKTEEGSRSEIPFALSPSTWEKVAAEADSCNHVHCPEYKRCYYYKAKKEAADAQLIVVNHHLLFSDLSARQRLDFKEEKAIIPSFEHLVLDEAHTLEEVALDIFSTAVDRHGLVRLLGKISSDVHPERCRLALVRQTLQGLPTLSPHLIHLLEVALPAQKREIIHGIEAAFGELDSFLTAYLKTNPQKEEWEVRLRLDPAVITAETWSVSLTAMFIKVAEELKHFTLQLGALERQLSQYKDGAQEENIKNHTLDLHSLGQRIEEKAELLSAFFTEKLEDKKVKWIEWKKNRYYSNVALFNATLDVSRILEEHLFRRLRGAVLCSATLTSGGNFKFAKERLGLAAEEPALPITENIYESPFDYENRVLLLVPNDLSAPSDPQFIQLACENILLAIEASQGSAFVLFTSYEMLQACYEKTQEKISFPLMKQGDLPRHQLIEKFRAREGNVLFATDSFWEGVDVPGEALRCVILVKLPFKVPSDPLFAAYMEMLEKEGKNPFYDYSVPQAVIKFKQGFGRLMRKKWDRGCILCLDNRILKKHYGKVFLKSLPPCGKFFGPASKVKEEMKSFYARTRIGA